MALPLAHAGHYIEGAIFAVPVSVLVAALTISSWRQKRSAKRGAGSPRDRDGRSKRPSEAPAKRNRSG